MVHEQWDNSGRTRRLPHRRGQWGVAAEPGRSRSSTLQAVGCRCASLATAQDEARRPRQFTFFTAVMKLKGKGIWPRAIDSVPGSRSDRKRLLRHRRWLADRGAMVAWPLTATLLRTLGSSTWPLGAGPHRLRGRPSIAWPDLSCLVLGTAPMLLQPVMIGAPEPLDAAVHRGAREPEPPAEAGGRGPAVLAQQRQDLPVGRICRHNDEILHQIDDNCSS